MVTCDRNSKEMVSVTHKVRELVQNDKSIINIAINCSNNAYRRDNVYINLWTKVKANVYDSIWVDIHSIVKETVR